MVWKRTVSSGKSEGKEREKKRRKTNTAHRSNKMNDVDWHCTLTVNPLSLVKNFTLSSVMPTAPL